MKRPASTATKLAAFRKKHHAMPSRAMTAAAMAGPTTRARLKPLELSAIASGRSSRPTRSIIIAWRAGISIDAMSPPVKARMSRWPIVIRSVTVSSQSADAWQRKANCAIRTMRSLSERSTIAPAGIVKTRIGTDAAVATRPTRKALFVSWSASQPSAIVCIHEPMRESVCPIRKSRKFRCLTTMRNGLIEAGADTAEI